LNREKFQAAPAPPQKEYIGYWPQGCNGSHANR